MFKKIFLAVLASMLSACGGGVEDSSPPITYNYSQGTPSSETSADQTITNSLAYSLPFDAPNGTSYASVSAANVILNAGGDAVATVDTNARSAWQQGWTGKNVKVGIADSFNSNGRIDAHGDWVALVQSSVAPEATVEYADVLSTSTLVGLLLDITSAYNYFETNGYHIVNNSWGIERAQRDASGAYTGAVHSDFDSLVNTTVQGFSTSGSEGAQGLYIMAGGNGGVHCGSRQIENCNWIAAVTDKLRENGYPAGSRLILVGSLDDNSNNLAGYSYFAGDLKEDFIVAHDDIFSPGDGAGTSFAAPRVAGAAALVKQKFPNLTSEQIKQVILQTADDLGTTGVDAVFGYGKLNVLNTLSPHGRVVPK